MPDGFDGAEWAVSLSSADPDDADAFDVADGADELKHSVDPDDTDDLAGFDDADGADDLEHSVDPDVAGDPAGSAGFYGPAGLDDV